MTTVMLTVLAVIQTMVAYTVCAPLTGGVEKIQPGPKAKAPMISAERELQDLVGAGSFGEPRQSTFSKQPEDNQQHVAPSDLARAVSKVDSQLVAQPAAVGAAGNFNQHVAPVTPSPASTGDNSDQVGTYADLTQLLRTDLTPRAVAEYLLITGEFSSFEAAIEDLLKAKIISPAEAKQYKDAVGWEYEALLYKLVSAKEMSLQEFMKDNQIKTTKNLPTRPAQAFNGALLAEPRDDQSTQAQIEAELRRLQVRALLEKEATLDELINAISRKVSVDEENTQETDLNRELTETIELLSEAIDEAAPANMADIYQTSANVPMASINNQVPQQQPKQPEALKTPLQTIPGSMASGVNGKPQQQQQQQPSGGQVKDIVR